MKQILKLILLLVIGQTAFGQAPSNYTNINGRYRWIAGMFDSTFHIPKGSTPSLRTGGSTNSGGLFYNTSDSSVYTYTGTQWIKLRGSINPSDTTNKYVTQVYKKSGSDSVFYVKGGTHTWAFNDSTGSPGGGGGGKVYYFNGGVNMGTIGGLQMYELGDTANTGAAANFTRSTTGNIANFITDPGKPGLLQIPAGVWSVDAWLSETGGGANHAEIWIEVEKWDGSTITTIATSPIEQITEGATPNLYSWSVSIPTTSLTVTDRIIIQFYISNTNGKTVTLYTQNGYVGEVHTTFTTGIGAINGLTAPAQYLVTGTSGTDFNINSSTATHTFNLPTASATNRGALSTTDWSTFNSKIGPSDTASMLSPYLRSNVAAATYVPQTRTITINGTSQDLSANRTYNVGTVTSVATNTGTGITGGTITSSGTIAADTLLLSTRAWRQKGVDSVASLINTRISGTTNYIPKFTSSSAIGNSAIYDNGGGEVLINTTADAGNYKLQVDGAAWSKGQALAGNYANLTDFGQVGIYATNASFADGFGTLVISGRQDNARPILFTTYNGTSVGERMRLDASGNLGLGVTPSAWGNLTKAIQISNTGASVWSYTSAGTGAEYLFVDNNTYNDNTNNIYIRDGAAARYRQLGGEHSWWNAPSGTAGNTASFTQAMTLDASGRLGLGTTDIEETMTVARVGGGDGIIAGFRSDASFSQFTLSTANSQVDFGFNVVGNRNMFFSTNSAERMRITSSGELLINTTSDAGDYKLQVNGNGYFSNSGTAGADLSLNQTGTGGRNYIIASTGSSFGSAGNLAFIDQTAVATRMLLNSNGELLINTTTDAGDFKLQVNGNSYFNGSATINATTGNNDLVFLATTRPSIFVNSTNIGLQIRTNGTGVLELNGDNSSTGDVNINNALIYVDASASNVGIGTNAPSAKLEVNGAIKTAAPSAGNAAAWKLGERVASAGVTFNDQQYIQLDIAGTTYYLATVDLPMPEAYPQATSGPSNNYKMAPVQVKTTRDAEIEKLRKEIEELKQLIKNK